MTIGARLEQYYKSKQLRQKAFAESVGLSITTLNNIVLGVSKPSFPVLEAIANAHKDLDLRWLITGKSQIWDNTELSAASEPPSPYGKARVKELYIPVPAKCQMTGAGCAFERLSKLADMEKEIAELKKKLEEK